MAAPSLARPEGRVHFAGDHTSAWIREMQGALQSGNRAAREVNEAP
ncbi:MAG: FAD-dependent oxidoreductase [Acidobacteriota bacterium]